MPKTNLRDLDVYLGQNIEYVVVDDEKSSRDRVVLSHGAGGMYDPAHERHNSPELSRVFCRRLG